MVAEIQKILFLCNCCSTIIVPSLNDQSCCSSTTGRTKKAEWRQNHCQGGPRVAMVDEWRHSGRHSDRSMDTNCQPKEAQWWYMEDRSVAQVDAQCSEPVSDRPPRRPLCDCFEHAQNFTRNILSYLVLSCLISSYLILCTTLERPRQPFSLLSAFNGDLASFVVAQGKHKGRSPCVKGYYQYRYILYTDVAKWFTDIGKWTKYLWILANDLPISVNMIYRYR